MNERIIAIIALSGVIVGGVLQYLFSYKLKKIDFEITQEIESYTAYLDAVSGTTIAKKTNQSKLYTENITKLIKAKSNILISGSHDVTHALAEFERNGPVIKDEKSQKLFSEIINSMRQSLGKKEKIEANDLIDMLLGGSSFT